MAKTTFRASSDVALIKYWGKKDEVLRLPENGSVSMVLQGLDTVTTVEFDPQLSSDQIRIQGAEDEGESKRVSKHLDRIRQLVGVTTQAKVVSENTFPKGTGLSSSGSGFAALTLAACGALDLSLTQKDLSILARQGSGTACRCVCGGIVEWQDGDSSESSFSETIFSTTHWDIRDVIAVVDEGHKKISSTEGHQSAQSSLVYAPRLAQIKQKILTLKSQIEKRDFEAFGRLIEAEALEFHSILLTSQPPLIAWYPGTIEVMLAVQALRQVGIPAYFTINTGFNVHVLTLPEYEEQVKSQIEQLSLVKRTILARIGEAPSQISSHLF